MKANGHDPGCGENISIGQYKHSTARSILDGPQTYTFIALWRASIKP